MYSTHRNPTTARKTPSSASPTNLKHRPANARLISRSTRAAAAEEVVETAIILRVHLFSNPSQVVVLPLLLVLSWASCPDKDMAVMALGCPPPPPPPVIIVLGILAGCFFPLPLLLPIQVLPPPPPPPPRHSCCSCSCSAPRCPPPRSCS